MTSRIIAGLALLCLWAAPLTASAVPIVGEITFSGDFVPIDGNGMPTGLADATGLDFKDDDFVVNESTEDFLAAGIVAGAIGFIQDFQFDPLNPAPVSPLWTIGGFQFSLEIVDVVFQMPGLNYLILEGLGTLSGAGFSDTSGTWSLTANGAGILYNFAAGSVAEVYVPEPGTLGLFAIGLFALAFMRRRQKQLH